jgi:hypothetical protein
MCSWGAPLETTVGRDRGQRARNELEAVGAIDRDRGRWRAATRSVHFIRDMLGHVPKHNQPLVQGCAEADLRRADRESAGETLRAVTDVAWARRV